MCEMGVRGGALVDRTTKRNAVDDSFPVKCGSEGWNDSMDGKVFVCSCKSLNVPL